MSTVSHTPGPWTVCQKGNCPCGMVWGASDYPVATVTIGPWGDEYPSIRQMAETGSVESKFEAYLERIEYGSVDAETAVSNARLIAAAPELLAALQRLEPFLDSIVCYASTMDEYEPNRIVVDARAAIAKAVAA